MTIKDETVVFTDPVLQKWPERGSFVIFDLEYTAWEGSHARGWCQPWERREIIEIGAVRVLVESNSYINQDTFHLYVRPTINPRLSDYIIRLTGISDKLLKNQGKDFGEALDKFCAFVVKDELLFSNGFDGAVVRENCLLNKLEYPFEREQVLNIRPALAEILRCSISDANSGDLPKRLGIQFSAPSHSALGDALSIAAALGELKKAGRLN